MEENKNYQLNYLFKNTHTDIIVNKPFSYVFLEVP